MSVSELAVKSRVHRNRVSAFEHGVANLELNSLLALCDALDLTVLVQPKELAGARPPAPGEKKLTNLQMRLAQQLGTAGASATGSVGQVTVQGNEPSVAKDVGERPPDAGKGHA